MNPTYSDIAKRALWRDNPGLVQLLGLCPLLAVSNSVVNGVGLGIATTMVLIASNTTVSLIKGAVQPQIRIAVFVMIIASFVTVVEMIMSAYFYDLYRVLGIFIPLIVTNCAILGRAEAFASKHDPLRSALDGLLTGLGFALVLIVLGACREILGQGTLLSQLQMMFGGPPSPGLVLFGEKHGLLLALMPPGAFLGLGLLIAAKNFIDERTDS